MATSEEPQPVRRGGIPLEEWSGAGATRELHDTIKAFVQSSDQTSRHIPMTPPEIQALGITQDGFTMRWKARGYVDGLGWLEAWGESLVAAMEALQKLVAERVAEASKVVEEDETP
jgi:hypothetical protein